MNLKMIEKYNTFLKMRLNMYTLYIVLNKLLLIQAKRTEDMQKKRVQDARNAHKQFINNALEDIHLRKQIREKELMEVRL